MDGETNGSQENVQTQEEQTQGQQASSAQVDGGNEVKGAATPDYEKQIAERDEKIAALEAQISESAKTAEAAEVLRSEIAELKKASADERVDFALQLAGCRNVKAARAILDDYDGDIAKLKEGEPWIFAKHAAGDGAGASGKTGLPNAGAASDEGKTMARWREVAGLADEPKKNK